MLTKEIRSYNMSRIKGKNTKPEMRYEDFRCQGISLQAAR